MPNKWYLLEPIAYLKTVFHFFLAEAKKGVSKYNSTAWELGWDLKCLNLFLALFRQFKTDRGLWFGFPFEKLLFSASPIRISWLRTFVIFLLLFLTYSLLKPQLYPTSMRATGAGTTNAMGRIGGMICPVVLVGLVTGCNQTAAVLVFEAIIVLSVVSVLLFQFKRMGQKLSNT